ncbi:DNA repair and recombination protein RadB [Candidatus Pacearchaeota archaeon]|nr:DNA repair and recombination protein RadB [Candidatus Pacearchaeota archaeon]
METESRISAGAYDLNKFLVGGYETDIITTLYGSGGSGKSNFCIMVAVSQAKKGNKVIFIDTEGGFSVDRFRQIHSGEESDIKRDLQNVLLLKPTSFKEQEKSFEQLLKHVKAGDVNLIVVDSIAMLYRIELGEAINSKDSYKISEVNRKLAVQLRTLNEISRKQNIPVIVTNQVYSTFISDDRLPSTNSTSEPRASMVGGDLLKYWSKCIIELQNNFGKRKIILKKHRSIPNKEFNFEIVNTGIKKKSAFF